MQYVRNISDSVSTAWNSINPATLSGAIDVIVIEREDGTLTCSPFHVRFGKFSLLRPYEKKVEFKVNGAKQDYSMKLGEGGEAFFVFETTDTIPQSLQTSPLVSPASSPPFQPEPSSGLQDPEPLELDSGSKSRSASFTRPTPTIIQPSSTQRENGMITPLSTSPEFSHARFKSGDWASFGQRPYSDDILRKSTRKSFVSHDGAESSDEGNSPLISDRSNSPPPLAPQEAIERAMALSRELSAVNIPTKITDTGDLMLDMTGFKHSEEDSIRAEILARKVLSEELQGNYDVGALFGMDDQGNLWIYSSEDAKEAAMKKTMESSLRDNPAIAMDAASDPGYHSDDSSSSRLQLPSHRRTESDVGHIGLQTPPTSPGTPAVGNDPNRNYAKTLRLTSDQLKDLNLKPGENSMSFTVNRATCQAFMYLWKHDTPVVISDIDGTITKSDALGHVLNMIGRDWTHAGVAKLYSDIVANGYNIMYLTSRSVGQSDMTRAYLAGVSQEGYRLPRGPTILSPDRTMAALRREVYLRKPHVFKMSTLRDIRNLYGSDHHPFYAGFGNRLSDQISYRTVDVPRNRIFTINSNAEVSLDLLSLNKLKLSYVNMTEVVDHYFPPVSMLVTGGGEEYTDFKYWRDTPLELDEFSASGSEVDETEEGDQDSQYADEEEEEVGEGLGDSYISRGSVEEYEDEVEVEGNLANSMIEDEEDADDEEEEEIEADDDTQPVPPQVPAQDGPQHRAAPDLDAEIITGVKNLAMEKSV